jgi:protein subunit release factor B
MKTKVCTVTMKDIEIQTFCAGGAGGQNQNRNQTGVRLIHKHSGARGESREFKSQMQNKRAALRRLSKTKEFLCWAKRMAGVSILSEEEVERKVNGWLQEKNIKIEVGGPGKWTKLG